MLRHRVIPVVLLDGYSVVKTIRFKERRNLGNPIAVAKIYNTRNVDELVLLDIDASKMGEKIDDFTIQEVASECFMPLAVGGGLRTCKDIQKVLAKGADKVVINSEALRNPHFIEEASREFGQQCIVVSIDVILRENKYAIYSHAKVPTTFGVLETLRQMEGLGAGEILLNSVDRDGTMMGGDLDLIAQSAEVLSIPLVAVGGCRHPDDAPKFIRAGASAIGAASIFHFTDYTPQHLRNALKEAGHPVR